MAKREAPTVGLDTADAPDRTVLAVVPVQEVPEPVADEDAKAPPPTAPEAVTRIVLSSPDGSSRTVIVEDGRTLEIGDDERIDRADRYLSAAAVSQETLRREEGARMRAEELERRTAWAESLMRSSDEQLRRQRERIATILTVVSMIQDGPHQDD